MSTNNDHAASSSAVSNLTFYTVTATGLNLSNTVAIDGDRTVLDRLVELLEINAQPIVVSKISNTVLKIGTEHVLPAATLQAAIRANAGTVDFANTTVTLGM